MDDPIQEQIEEANKAIDQLGARYRAQQIAPPDTYRMGNDEFNHRCMMLILIDVMKEMADMSEEEWDLRFKLKWLDQAEQLLKNTMKMRDKNGKPKMFLPPGMQS